MSDQITPEDINEVLDEMISTGQLISEKIPASADAMDQWALEDYLFKQAERADTLSKRMEVIERLLRYAVLKLPETQRNVAQEIMHLCGIEPASGPENDEEGYQGEGTDPYTGAEAIEL